jgi:LPXTG-site transpeptidase (sortase) family protein
MSQPLRGPVVWLLAVVFLLTACGGQPVAAVATTTTTSVSSAAVPTSTPVAPSATAVATAVSTAAPLSNTTSVSQSATAVPPTATPVPAKPSATPVPVIPVKLQIPAIDVTAPVELVGLTADGAMDVPKQWNDVGWYEYGPAPGQVGNAAIAGHLDSTTAPAVFWRLGSLKPGDKIMVTLSNSQTVTFVVKQKVSYAYNDAPIAQVFGPASTANLNLITCGGTWDAYTKNYSNRIVVYTTRA